MTMSMRGLWSAGVPFLLAVCCWLPTPVFGQAADPDTSGIVFDGEYGYGFPPDVSADGHRVDQLINVLHWFMLVLFVGWGTFMAYCLLRFRKRAGQRAVHETIKAKPVRYLEIAVVAFEAVLLLGFSIPIWGSVKNDIPTPEDNPLRIRVLAEQFAWNFHYPGVDGVFGRAAPQYLDAVTNPVGIDPNDPNGADDIVTGELNIVVDRPVICEVSSKDVIHSFSIPVMRVKQDVIPGMRIPVWFEAKKTGTYQVACAQLCGNNHYKMSAPMVIRTPEAFAAWLVEASAPPEEFEEDDLED
jgi:cytochrome c oxidase subunit 2